MLLQHPTLPPEQTIDVPEAAVPLYKQAGWREMPSPVPDLVTPPAARRHTKKEDK
ncbi:hypothetical protein [Streptomyces sp. NPDC088923]|uniref:hypothetical protein n=1 Tax=Streptomyces sp. NPDC088923 TaxID=3365913 RepID=UPI00382429DD